jgi:hypothetical protein
VNENLNPVISLVEDRQLGLSTSPKQISDNSDLIPLQYIVKLRSNISASPEKNSKRNCK